MRPSPAPYWPAPGTVPFFDFVNRGGIVYVLFAPKEGFFLFGGVVCVLLVSTMGVGYLLLGVAATLTSARSRCPSQRVGTSVTSLAPSAWFAACRP